MTTKLPTVRERVACGTSEYASIHAWLRREYGRPLGCENTDCSGTSKVFDWAVKRDMPHARNRDNYLRLCRSCHIKYDMTPERKKRIFEVGHTEQANRKRSEKLRGTTLPEEQKQKLRESSARKPVRLINDTETLEFESITAASKHLGVIQTAIWLVMHGRNKSVKGYRAEYINDI